MFRIIIGMVIGSLLTYNVILPNDDYNSAFVKFNDYAMAKISALLADVKEAGEEKI